MTHEKKGFFLSILLSGQKTFSAPPLNFTTNRKEEEEEEEEDRAESFAAPTHAIP